MNVFDFKNENWFRIAMIIDNEFGGTQNSFMFNNNRTHKFFYLDSNKCDYSSLIKVYYGDGGQIISITRIAEDTDGWKNIYPQTMERVNQYISTLNK